MRDGESKEKADVTQPESAGDVKVSGRPEKIQIWSGGPQLIVPLCLRHVDEVNVTFLTLSR